MICSGDCCCFCFTFYQTTFCRFVQIKNIYRVQFNSTTQLLTTLRKKAFENIVGKGENAGYQPFLLFPQCFLPYLREKLSFQ